MKSSTKKAIQPWNHIHHDLEHALGSWEEIASPPAPFKDHQKSSQKEPVGLKPDQLHALQRLLNSITEQLEALSKDYKQPIS